MNNKPLYTSLQPKTIEDFIGQEHLLATGKVLNVLIEKKTPISMLFYGRPGIGKTTLARIFVEQIGAAHVMFNASNQTKKELQQAIQSVALYDTPFVIIDEIHRLDKAKQDYLLEVLENGKIFVIGITTENPYFHTREALRSRLTLIEFKNYNQNDLISFAKKVITENNFVIASDIAEKIVIKSSGDIRTIINLIEICEKLSHDEQSAFLVDSSTHFNNDTNDYYDLISALQKSIRGSDVDAALTYLVNLLELGHLEEVSRRLMVIAYEVVGFGNISSIERTKTAVDVAKVIGMPEALYPLSFATIDLALSPKSRIVGNSFSKALGQLMQKSEYEIPEFIKYKNSHLYKEVYPSPDIAKYRYLPNKFDEVIDFSYVANTKYEQFLIQQYNSLLKDKK